MTAEPKFTVGNTNPDRPAVYQDTDGMWAYRPSCLGKCVRGLTAARVGVPAAPLDERSETICNEGRIHEPHIVEWFQKQGFLVRRNLRVGAQITLYTKIVGEVDGVAWKDEDIATGPFDFDPGNVNFPLYGVECKALGDKPHEWTLKEGLSEEYAWQLSAYWVCLEFFYARRLDGFYFIMKRRHDGFIQVLFFKVPPYNAEQVMERIAFVEHLAAERMKKIEHGDFSWPACDRDDMFCPWKAIHDYDYSKFDPTMEPLVKKYHELKVLEDAIEGDMKQCKWDLLRAMAGRKKVKTGKDTVTINPGRERFDQAACLRDFPDLKNTYTVRGEAFLKVYKSRKKEG